MLASPLYIQEREREWQVLTHAEFITLIENIRRRAHHSFGQVRGNLHRSSHKHRASFRHKKRFRERQQVQELLELRAHQAAPGEQEALSRRSEAEFRTRILSGTRCGAL